MEFVKLLVTTGAALGLLALFLVAAHVPPWLKRRRDYRRYMRRPTR